MWREIGTAAATIVLALPATAGAATWTVDPAAPNGCDAEKACGSIQSAAGAAGNRDEIRIKPHPTAWDEDVEFKQAGLTVRGDGTGEVRIAGSLTFTGSAVGTGSQSFTIQNLVVRAAGPALSFTSVATAPPKTVEVQSSILSGSGSVAALAASNEAGVGNSIAITARHVTIADEGTAPAYVATGDDITATFHDSIVKGDAPGATLADNNDTATADALLFVDPAREDFHLRAGSPALNQGRGPGGGEIAEDVDGQAREAAWDRGADEFLNRPPNAPGLSASPTEAATGSQVTFEAADGGDPDAALGDRITGYRWDFGDGTGTDTAEPRVAHAFGAAGRYDVRVRALDVAGAAGDPSAAVAVSVSDPPPPPATGPILSGGVPPLGNSTPRRAGPDVAAPWVAIASPRRRQRVKVGRRGPPPLRGRAADDSGVRRIELALMRRERRRCRWYDGRRAFRLGPCGRPRWFRAVIDDFTWSHRFPRGVRPRPATYHLRVRATDRLGNTSSAFRAAARTAIVFRYVR